VTLLVVVGMRAEAALLPAGLIVAIGTNVLPTGVGAVLSFGIAGGLDPSLRPGDLVVASRVRGPGGAYLADPAWAAALARATGARLGILAGAAAAVATPAAKRALRDATGALAVDMESEAVAAFAALHSLPFAALRAVADPADAVVPRAALVGLDADGRAAPGRVLLALLRRPGELRPLLRVAADARTALAALRRVAGHVALPAAAGVA